MDPIAGTACASTHIDLAGTNVTVRNGLEPFANNCMSTVGQHTVTSESRKMSGCKRAQLGTSDAYDGRQEFIETVAQWNVQWRTSSRDKVTLLIALLEKVVLVKHAVSNREALMSVLLGNSSQSQTDRKSVREC